MQLAKVFGKDLPRCLSRLLTNDLHLIGSRHIKAKGFQLCVPPDLHCTVSSTTQLRVPSDLHCTVFSTIQLP